MVPPSEASPIRVKLLALSVDIILKNTTESIHIHSHAWAQKPWTRSAHLGFPLSPSVRFVSNKCKRNYLKMPIFLKEGSLTSRDWNTDVYIIVSWNLQIPVLLHSKRHEYIQNKETTVLTPPRNTFENKYLWKNAMAVNTWREE